MSMPGSMVPATGETQTSDGGDMGAPMDMGGACEQAVSAADACCRQNAPAAGLA